METTGDLKMPKHTYPNRICWDCVALTGKQTLVAQDIVQEEAVCDVCKRKGVVVPPVSLGHFSREQIALARSECKRLGLYKADGVTPEAMYKAITIVEGVLGTEHMSLWTKKMVDGIKADLESGKSLTKYDLEKLMFWFTNDVNMMKEKEEAPSPIITVGK
jgi:hypothetical protein